MALHAGTIEDMRLHNFTAVRVMDRLKEMDETLIFGYEYVVGCVNSLQKTEEQRTLNEMCDSVKKLEKLMPLYEGLGQKVLVLSLWRNEKQLVAARPLGVDSLLWRSV